MNRAPTWASAVTVVVALAAACPTGSPVVDGGGDDAGIVDARWIVRAPLAVGPRQETGVVALRGEIVVVGGFDADDGVTDDVLAYDPASDAWRALAPLPFALHHANVAVVDDTLYVLGSLLTISFLADRRALAYDAASDAWSERAPLPAGRERGGGVALVVDARVWVVGGVRGGNAVAEVDRYDPATDTWSAGPDLPEPRDHLVGALVDGVVLAIGGREGRIASHAPTVFALPVGAETWEARAALPTSRGGMAGAAWGGYVYVLGGEGNTDDDRGVFAHVERYDVAADAWATLPAMPTPRHGMGAAALDGVIYVPGGADIAGLAAVATHEALVVDE